jgi:hypothetical protein
VQAADAGSTITVTVTRSDNSGSVTSAGIQIPAIPVSVDITVRNTAEWNAALDSVKNGGNGTTAFPKPYNITVSGNIMVSGNTAASFGAVSNVTVTINGNGKLYLLGQGSILNIAKDQTVNIDSASLTLQGLKTGQNDSSQDNNKAVVSVTGGTLELRKGTISGNSGGSGVSADSGSFNMTGGTISGNTGGVGVSSGGSFTMTDGTISGNTGGTGVYNTGSFTMTGGTIRGNSNESVIAYGGGVYSGGSFTMSGGTISNNLCGITPTRDYYINRGYGGGVYIGGGSFTMSGGTISNNSARGGGYNYSSSLGSTILYTSNTADNWGLFVGGGGVYIDAGSFTKSGGGSISGNNVPPAYDLPLGSGYPNGKEVFFKSSPVRYRDTPLGTSNDINTNTLTGWGQ